MASAMPVLPEVGSISVSPRLMRPRASATAGGWAMRGVDGGKRELVEALRAPGAAVVDAGAPAPLEEPEVDRDHVVDVDEVAALPAVGIAVRADEELHPAFVVQLLI